MVIDPYFTIILLITTVSVLLQCYLLFMLIYASPKSMVTYKYYLCVISVWDLLFAAALGYGLHPKVLFPYGCASVNGFFQYFGQTGAKVGLSIVLFTAVCVIMAEVNCLLYRMTVILSDERIHEWYMKPVCVIFIQIVIIGLAAVYGIRLFDIFLDEKQIPEWLQRYSLVWLVPPPSNDTILLAIEFDPAFTQSHSRASALTTTIGICTLELLFDTSFDCTDRNDNDNSVRSEQSSTHNLVCNALQKLYTKKASFDLHAVWEQNQALYAESSTLIPLYTCPPRHLSPTKLA
ncbi:serpentine type 7TM GPCR chemoreceptor srh domain-containing protein [Ditylenchus destructor]|nr:serpentine type 7TM GPCR chemoreceptor srh domain-containing protein [Ditylenchus destructor]